MPARSEAPNRNRKFLNAYAEGSQLVLFYRTADGRVAKQVERCDPTCFIRASDLAPEQLLELRRSSAVTGMRQEGDFWRITWRDRDALRLLTRPGGLFAQKEIPTFEADVDPVRRWLTDHPEATIDRPRRCYLDIESDSRVAFAKKSEARTLAWCVLEHDTGRKFSAVLEVDTDEAERALLIELWTVLSNFDQVVAWNGDRFDFPQIENRSLARGISIDVRRWLWLDHMVLFRRMNMSASESGEEKQSFALGAVAKAVIGRGKLELDEDELEALELESGDVLGAKTWEIWTRSRDAVRRYVEDDTELMFEIEKETGYVELLQTVCDTCTVFPDTAGIQPTKEVEGFLMRLAAPLKKRFRTHYYQRAAVEKFRGAFVMDPTPGLYTDEIHVGDFSGMYPSIILTWNMSPETFDDTITLRESPFGRPSYLLHVPLQEFPIPEGFCAAPITDVCFRNEPRGLLAQALEQILGLRKSWNKKKAALSPGTTEWKEADRRATAYKIVANCFYGVIGSPFSRFFEKPVAESVSQAGFWLIQKTIDAIQAPAPGMPEKKGTIPYEPARRGRWRVIYGDTDSIFAVGCTREEFAEFVKWCNTTLYPELLKLQKTTRNFIEFAYEKAFRRAVFLKKKRYAAMWAHYKGTEATDESKPEIKGLEFKRGDSLKLARELQRDAIHMLLGFKREPSDDPASFEKLIESYQERVLRGELNLSEVVVSKKLAKPIAEYVRKPKKTAPAMHKLYGEDVVVKFSDLECGKCGAVPTSELTIRAGRCSFCDGTFRKRVNIARGMVEFCSGDFIAVSDGRKAALVWKATISELVAFSSLPPHVQIARELASRGRDVGQNVRVEYVVVDHRSPFGTIPAEDWYGEADRVHLWEQVYEPTLRVLEAAFPGHDWAKYRPGGAPAAVPTESRDSVPARPAMTARQALAAGVVGNGKAKPLPSSKSSKKKPTGQSSLF